ncbi:hypothetical protein LY474_17915 [Myxococcus stipitatus]|uniref:4-hydroxyphenylacetate 3-hydroxylase family protein n=1 Tax=Myxococcus stipitatus TaxID=83455 RepID=UPI001F48A5A4|nr:4-hydroxyphenylacetate 3-hydroxylase N-terminal domain-containing protein [Myxococcus stipitatus]MCE9669675.1 hypothetical protein [Myxococcus stipitatus]
MQQGLLKSQPPPSSARSGWVPDREGALSTAGARGAWRGEDFVASLRDGREVWYDGERVDVTRHPSFAGALRTLAGLYDAQHDAATREQMLWRSPDHDHLVSYSYLPPRTVEDLNRKWRNSHLWMERSHGQLARVPDFMANVVVGLYDFRGELAKVDPRFGENAERYHRYCREHDLALTHALGDPQIDRSSSPVEHPEYALRVVERRPDGIVVHGAKQLATLAPYCHEALVYLSPAFYARAKPEYVAWFAVPIATPGLKLLCRESHGERHNHFDHAFSSRFDEQDAMLFFDHVFVPMSRVFLLEDTATAARGFHEVNKWSLYTGQIRFYHRLRTFLGVASLVSQAIGVNQFREVASRLGELTSYVELVRLGLVAMNAEPQPTVGGLIAPGSTLALDAFAAQISSRITEILRVIGGSGIVMQPSQRDLENPELRPYLDQYMKGKDVGVAFKAKLFRLAFELVGDRFGLRQELYEYWNRGDVVRTHTALYEHYFDRAACEAKVKELLS